MTLPHRLKQSFLQKLFVPGAGAAKSPSQKTGELPATAHQRQVQARVIEHLKRHGGIDARTVQFMGTTDARKIFTRLREKGYLYPATCYHGHEVRPNYSGRGTYRWHRWTGKE